MFEKTLAQLYSPKQLQKNAVLFSYCFFLLSAYSSAPDNSLSERSSLTLSESLLESSVAAPELST